jgi:hypothetical protein
VLELGGVKDILTKCLGTRTPINLVRATVDAIEQLRLPEEVAALRGKSVEEVLGKRLSYSASSGHVGITTSQWAERENGEGGAATAVAEETTTEEAGEAAGDEA